MGFELFSEKRRTILVDHGFDTTQSIIGVTTTEYPCADDDDTGVDEPSHGVALADVLQQWCIRRVSQRDNRTER